MHASPVHADILDQRLTGIETEPSGDEHAGIPTDAPHIELAFSLLGQVLEVVSDDEGIKKDMPAWCETTGHQMVGLEEEQAKSGPIYKAFVKKTK